MPWGKTIKLNEPERQKIEKQLTLTAPELQQKGPSFLYSQITHHHSALFKKKLYFLNHNPFLPSFSKYIHIITITKEQTHTNPQNWWRLTAAPSAGCPTPTWLSLLASAGESPPWWPATFSADGPSSLHCCGIWCLVGVETRVCSPSAPPSIRTGRASSSCWGMAGRLRWTGRKCEVVRIVELREVLLLSF